MALRRNVFLVSTISIAFLLTRCDTTVGDPEPLQELVPLTEGNRWSYQLTYAGIIDSFTVEITRSLDVRHEGHTYRVYGQSFRPNVIPEFPLYAWLYANGRDGLYNMGGVADTDTFAVRFLHRKFPGRVGDTWPMRRIGYRESSSGKFEIIDTLWVRLVAIDEPIETPLGVFTCHVYKYTFQPAEDVAGLWDVFEYYAPGTGQVAEITRDHPSPSSSSTEIKQQVLIYDFALR
jgi:hypothetical protein